MSIAVVKIVSTSTKLFALAAAADAMVIATALTSTEILTIIAAVSALVLSIGGVAVNIITALKTNTAIQDVSAKTEVIKGSVDGAASKQEAKLDAALKELAFMRTVVSDQKQTAAVLAATAASPVAPVASASPLQATVPVEASLKKIDINTAETAANTAKTDAKVDALTDKS